VLRVPPAHCSHGQKEPPTKLEPLPYVSDLEVSTAFYLQAREFALGGYCPDAESAAYTSMAVRPIN